MIYKILTYSCLLSFLIFIPHGHQHQYTLAAIMVSIFFGWTAMNKSKVKISLYRLDLIWLLLLFYFLIRSIFSLNTSFSFFLSFAWCLSFCFWKFCTYKPMQDTQMMFVKGIKISYFILLALVGIFYISNWDSFISIPYVDYDLSRTFLGKSSNFITSLLCIYLPFIFVSTDSKLTDRIILFSIPVSLYIILTSISQTQIILVFIILILMVLHYMPSVKSIKKYLFISGGLSVMVVSLYIGYFKLLDKRIPMISEFRGLRERFDMWDATLTLFTDNFIFGIGLGNWPTYINSLLRLKKPHATPHNVYLEFLSDNGIVGAILISLLLFSILKTYYKNEGKFKKIEYAALVSSFSFLVSSFFYGTVMHEYMLYGGGIFIFIMNLSILYKAPSQSLKVNGKILLPIFSIFLSVIFIFYSYKSASYDYAIVQKDKKKSVKTLDRIYDANLFTHRKRLHPVANKILIDNKKAKLKIDDLYYRNELVRISPNSKTFALKNIKSLRENGEYKEALEEAERLHAMEPDNYDFIIEAADLSFINGYTGKAQRYLSIIKKIKIPSSSDASQAEVDEILRVKVLANELNYRIRKKLEGE